MDLEEALKLLIEHSNTAPLSPVGEAIQVLIYYTEYIEQELSLAEDALVALEAPFAPPVLPDVN